MFAENEYSGVKVMYSAKGTEADKLEIFKQNEKWQKILDEFLGAWEEFFGYEKCLLVF